MYIATLFIIAKTWEQPRCSSVSELINRGASQTVEYYSAPKGNELWSIEETWRNLKILKWKKSVWKSYMLYDSSSITFLKSQYYGDSIKISDCQGLGRERWIELRRFLGQWKYSVWFQNDGYMSLYIYPNP